MTAPDGTPPPAPDAAHQDLLATGPRLKATAWHRRKAEATISRALKDTSDIGGKAKKRVRATCLRLDHRPDRAYARVRTAKTNVLALKPSTDADVMNHTSWVTIPSDSSVAEAETAFIARMSQEAVSGGLATGSAFTAGEFFTGASIAGASIAAADGAGRWLGRDFHSVAGKALHVPIRFARRIPVLREDPAYASVPLARAVVAGIGRPQDQTQQGSEMPAAAEITDVSRGEAR